MDSVYENMSVGKGFPKFRCGNVVSPLKREKYLRKIEIISTLEDEGNVLFETLGSGYHLAQNKVVEENPHFILLNYNFHNFLTA